MAEHGPSEHPRAFRFIEQSVGKDAAWRLVILRRESTVPASPLSDPERGYRRAGAAHGFANEESARAGAVAYMQKPEVLAVWIEAVVTESSSPDREGAEP